jgi:ABC-type polysaccharide/polyol phosphate transport system ATPase subunit
MSNIAIEVDDLSKLYRVGGPQERYKTLRDTVRATFGAPVRRARTAYQAWQRKRREPEQDDTAFWALKDVGFQIKPGEVVGVIGGNGAGKSTLLKILSRIIEPTSGYAEIHGRVGSLLEVGTGFHPELTGRENLFLNGAILGMRRAEIERKFDEIIAFAEIERFIDTPVKHYSSGMYLRLAFAVAAHLEPEILLVDEVLAVGDAAFQKKCLGKMGEVAKEGRTVLFVSHNMGAVSSLCHSGLHLVRGNLNYRGPIESCVANYLRESQASTVYEKRHRPPLRAFIQSARLVGDASVNIGESIQIETVIISEESFRFGLDWRIRSELGVPLAWGCPHLQFGQTEMLHEGENKFLFDIGPLPLSEGSYRVSLDIDVPQTEYVERIEDCLEFQIKSCVLGSPGHSIKALWNKGPVILPFVWRKV